MQTVKYSSEESVLHCAVSITGAFWGGLGPYVTPQPLIISYALNEKERASTTVTKGRPDETVYNGDSLTAYGEHKDEDITQAWFDIANKIRPYNCVAYGPSIRFLPVYVAAGKCMQFGFVDVVTGVVTKLPAYDFTISAHRALLIRQSINCLRYINTISPYLFLNPVRTVAFSKNGRVTFEVDCVHKFFDDRDTAPKALYELLSTGNSFRCAAKVVKKRTYLVVSPLGYKITGYGQKLTAAEMKNAVRSVLQCLEDLHSQGYCHRDIHWSNIIRDYSFDADGKIVSSRFIVIDFEYAATIDKKLVIPGRWFSSHVGQNVPYTKKHDIIQVGILIENWNKTHHDEITVDPVRVDFIQLLKAGTVTAREALNHAWFVDNVCRS
jgi:hypothetical protein